MSKTTSYIILQDVRFHAFHGVMPQERTVGADFTLNLRIGYDFSRAMETDDVDDTISYAAVYELVSREMAKPSKLLEHVAGRIANSLMKEYHEIQTLELRIMKDNPPMGADLGGAGVEIHLINDKTD